MILNLLKMKIFEYTQDVNFNHSVLCLLYESAFIGNYNVSLKMRYKTAPRLRIKKKSSTPLFDPLLFCFAVPARGMLETAIFNSPAISFIPLREGNFELMSEAISPMLIFSNVSSSEESFCCTSSSIL